MEVNNKMSSVRKWENICRCIEKMIEEKDEETKSIQFLRWLGFTIKGVDERYPIVVERVVETCGFCMEYSTHDDDSEDDDRDADEDCKECPLYQQDLCVNSTRPDYAFWGMIDDIVEQKYHDALEKSRKILKTIREVPYT